jgi:hypothetical protein
MLHARKQDFLGIGCTTLDHSYLRELSSIGMDKQWLKREMQQVDNLVYNLRRVVMLCR